MPTTPEYAFKEGSIKLLVLPPLRTIYFRTFQCDIPCMCSSNFNETDVIKFVKHSNNNQMSHQWR